MKLVYLTHWRFPSEKTMTPLILRTCAHFARRGWEVELWIPRRYNPYGNADVFSLYHIEPRFTVRRLSSVDLMRYLPRAGFPLMVATFNFFALLRLWGKSDVVLYAHDLRDLLLPSLTGAPMFLEIHDFFESSVRFFNRRIFRRAAGLVVTNTHKLEHLARTYGVARERMIRQQNAVDFAAFDIVQTKEEARAALGIAPERRVAMYTGHLFSWKGVRTLAGAAAFLPEDTDIYFIGGTEEDRADMERYVREKQLPRITFIPHQTPDKIPLYLRAADVLVLPNTAKEEASRVETSPVKLFEYLAAGKQIVASDLPSIRDIVTEREVFFARPDDPESFGNVIAEALRSPEASARIEASRALARKSSWEARAEAIESLIVRALAAPAL